MDDITLAGWKNILQYNALGSWDDCWALNDQWIEPLNVRRGGFSGVMRLTLQIPEGGTKIIYMKKQELHNSRSIRHPFRGEPTCAREARALLRCARYQIPSAQLVAYWQRDQRAILITESLYGYRGLDECIAEQPNRQQKISMIHSIATTLRALHQAQIQHNSCYPQHLLLHTQPDGKISSALIDFERSKTWPWARKGVLRDLESLLTRITSCSMSDKMRFLQSYTQNDHLTPEIKRLWRRLTARHRRRRGGLLHV